MPGPTSAGPDESGIDHVFIFPTHTQEGGYDMPQAEVDAFREIIIPGLARLS